MAEDPESPETPEAPHLPSPEHAEHDPLLVAALADRELDGPERERAEALVTRCTDCAELHADLVTIAVAVRDLPTPARPRDLRLTTEDVARLRPRGWRRLVAAIGSSRDALSRPLAIGLTTLGLAGLLVGTVPGLVPAGGGAAAQHLPAVGGPVDEQQKGGMQSRSADPEQRELFSGSDDAGAPADGGAGAAPEAGGPGVQQDVDTAAEPGPEAELAPDPSGMSGFVVVSGTFLIVGLGLFALRWTSRRLGPG